MRVGRAYFKIECAATEQLAVGDALPRISSETGFLE